MRKIFILLWLAAPLLAADAVSGRLERDLGQGLAYVRIHALPGDLPPTPAQLGAVVLDLRFASGDQPAASALRAWLQFRATVRTPVFVLVNAATSAAVLDYLESGAAIPGVITLGTGSARFVPDVTLKISAATDRSAYDALDQGTPLEILLTENPGKPRHDEAAIAQEHSVAPDTAEDSDTTLSDTAAPASTPAAPPPLIDATLQRAVHLHRALLALRKI